jgi:hypothetical protein
MSRQIVVISLLVLLLSGLGAPSQPASLTVVSAASFQADAPVAAEMIVSGFTAAIGNVIATATSLPLPTELASFSAIVRDSV